MPIDASFSSMGASAAEGGLRLNSSAKSEKYSTESIRLTCSRTGVFMSMEASTFPLGCCHSLPQALSGRSFTSS
ncbi:hypothetical protein D3C87_1957100 [compost metagenome]